MITMQNSFVMKTDIGKEITEMLEKSKGIGEVLEKSL